LTSLFTDIKVRKDTATKVPEKHILQLGFAQFCKENNLEPVSGNTIYNWLEEDFGIGSANGHTTLHPRKTDACDACVKFQIDINSVDASIRRHQQQHDSTIDRLNAIAALKEQLEDLQRARSLHIQTAAESKGVYDAAHAASTHDMYARLTDEFNGLPLSDFSAEVNNYNLYDLSPSISFDSHIFSGSSSSPAIAGDV